MDENHEFGSQAEEVPKPPSEYPAEGRPDISAESPTPAPKRKARPAKTRNRATKTAARSTSAPAKTAKAAEPRPATSRPAKAAPKPGTPAKPARPARPATRVKAATTDAPKPAAARPRVDPRVVAGGVAAAAAAAVGIVGLVRGRRKH
jgi:hypothetical protein